MARLPSKQNAQVPVHHAKPIDGNKESAVPGQAKPTTPKKKEKKKNLPDTPAPVLKDLKRGVEYERGKLLGEGGFARCYLAVKEGEHYAAKTVAKKSLASTKMKAKFFGEISVHKTMDHPNIVKFKECFEDSVNIYMILELCPNKSLAEIVRKRRHFTEPEARFYLLQILGGLKYMHSRNVIHRDLKLGNIFLDKDMNLKIGDFGLAALLVDGTERKKTICGTPNYIAPEILFNKEEGHSFEVDIWSAGIILYAMLIGKPPFQSPEIDTIYDKIKVATFDYPDTRIISPEAKDLIGALLNPDPRQRPAIDQVTEHPWFRSGYFPREIPIIAMTGVPHFRDEANSTPRDWAYNHLQVARASGVGLGIEPVGLGRGESLDILPVAESDGSDSENVAKPVVGRIPGTHIVHPVAMVPSSKLQGHAKRGERSTLLPDELSPRLTKTKMIKNPKMPSSLGPLRDIPSPAAIARRASSNGLDIAPKRSLPPTRASVLRPKDEADKENKEMHVHDMQKSNFNVVEKVVQETKMVKPRLPGVFVTASQEQELRRQPLTRSKTVQATDLGELAVKEKVVLKVAKTSHARHLSRGTYRATSTKMHSLAPEYVKQSVGETLRSIGAFLDQKLDTLSPRSAASKQAVDKATTRKKSTAVDPNSKTWICRWVDYSNKAGMGYILNDGTQGTLFKDHTTLVEEPINQDDVEECNVDHIIPQRLQKQSFPLKETMNVDIPSITKKADTHRRFGEYMRENLGETQVVKTSQEKKALQFVSHYARLSTVTVFRFEDGGIQFNFSDHNKIILHHNGRTVLFLDENKILHTISLEEAFTLIHSPRTSRLGANLIASDFIGKFGVIRGVLDCWFREMVNSKTGRDWLSDTTRLPPNTKLIVTMGGVGAA